MTFSEICFECRINVSAVEGVCEECLEELQKTWNKMDDWLMGNV